MYIHLYKYMHTGRKYVHLEKYMEQNNVCYLSNLCQNVSELKYKLKTNVKWKCTKMKMSQNMTESSTISLGWS